MIKLFTSQEKISEQAYSTGVPVGSGKIALDVAPKALFPISVIPETPVSSRLAVGTDGKRSKQIVEITSHGMREGDVLRFITGPLINIESVVIEVIDVNNLSIGNVIPDASTSTCLKMRHVTLTLNSSGSLVTSSGPAEYVLDGVATQVSEDKVTPANSNPLPSSMFIRVDGDNLPLNIDTATPANNVSLPSQMFYVRDGVITALEKDTVTPSNTRAMPVELVSTTGVEATFNVTTGDLNVEISHDGASHTWDSTRIGDGTNLMAVNASLQAEVHDADALAELQTLSAVDYATETTQDLVLTELQTLNTVDFATSAKQDDIITELQAIGASSLDVVDQLDGILLDASVDNIPASASLPLELVASLAADVKKIIVVEDIGEFFGLYVGAASSEALKAVLPLGGGEVELEIALGTRVSIRHMKNTAITSGNMAINFLG